MKFLQGNKYLNPLSSGPGTSAMVCPSRNYNINIGDDAMHINRAREEIIQTVNTGNPPKISGVSSLLLGVWLHQNMPADVIQAMYRHAKTGVNMDKWLSETLGQTNKYENCGDGYVIRVEKEVA
jgi:hypothetical protein